MRCKTCHADLDYCICGDAERSFDEDRALTFDLYETLESERHQARNDFELDSHADQEETEEADEDSFEEVA